MKAITVNPTSWHYRLYRWWATEMAVNERRLDLCRYMRCLLIWLPLSVVMFSALWLAIKITKPILWMFTRRRPKAALRTVGAKVETWAESPSVGRAANLVLKVYLASVCAAMLFALGYAFYSSLIVGLSIVAGVSTGAWLVVLLVWQSDFLGIVWAWVCAKKRRVCPFVEVAA